MARFPDLDRPFHLLKKMPERPACGPAALSAKPCIAWLCGPAAIRSARPDMTQNHFMQDHIPCSFYRSFPVCFREMGWKNRGLAGLPDLGRPGEGAPHCAANSPEPPGRGVSVRALLSLRHSDRSPGLNPGRSGGISSPDSGFCIAAIEPGSLRSLRSVGMTTRGRSVGMAMTGRSVGMTVPGCVMKCHAASSSLKGDASLCRLERTGETPVGRLGRSSGVDRGRHRR